MALVECSQCGQRISSSTSTCPECGHPVSTVIAESASSLEAPPDVTAAAGNPARTPAETAGEGPASRLPTWLLFVLVFAVGSVILVAGVIAASVVAESILGGTDNPTAASDTTVVAETTVPAVGRDGLIVGQCIDDEELDKYLAGDDFSLVPCDDPHDAEIYYVHEFPSGPYPGDETVVADLKSVCRTTFEDYVGIDYETSALHFWALWPSQGWWESGNRVGECALFDPDAGKLTGSAYQSGW